MSNVFSSMKRYERILLFILADIYLMGVIGFSIPLLRPYMKLLTPWVLILTGGSVFVILTLRAGRKFPIFAAIAYLLTFTAEAVGVATGNVFGPYHYTGVLGPMLFEVPVIIGFNWIMVLVGMTAFTERICCNRIWLFAVFTGIAAVLFDLVMEPVAINLQFWVWHGHTVPLQNYAAWFIIAVVLAFIYKLFRIRIPTTLPVWYTLLQTVFFILILTAIHVF